MVLISRREAVWASCIYGCDGGGEEVAIGDMVSTLERLSLWRWRVCWEQADFHSHSV